MTNPPTGKILVIPSWYPPDGGYFFREHSIALAEKGFEVGVIYAQSIGLKHFKAKDISLLGKVETTKREGITEHTSKFLRVPFLERASMQLWQRNLLRLFDWFLQKYGRPDLILAHSSIWGGVVAGKINQKYGIPYVITEHRSRFVNNFPEARQLFKPWYFPMLQKAFGNAGAVVTVSDSLQPFIMEIAPSIKSKIRTKFNMVDTEYFLPQKNKKSNKAFTFFSLGNLERVKGFDTLINAFSLLPEEIRAKSILVIGGSGSQRKNLEKLARQRGIEHLVTFTGKLAQSEVLENYQKADAFVLASNFEAFGVVYIEAMSCGLPVIATKSGGPQGFITPEQGILVEPGESKELAEAMEKIINNSSKFDSKAIRQHTINTFGHNVISGQYASLFDEIMNASQR